ncbi:restriction endonuclease subunit S [Streptomyces sp. NPDC058369]|uniref:restriction endonuclease subunit S n=1 Tax=Streptomyces sp. NPDC058369 TaxID=3346462 RepID=UPI00364FDA26
MELPAGWVWARLGDLLREPLRNGHSARSTKEAGGVRTLSLSAVTQDDFSDRNTKITVADPDRVSDLWLEAGDILIQRSNTPELVGTSAIYRGPDGWAIFPDLLIRVRLDPRVDSQYVALFLRSPRARIHFKSRAKGLAGSMPKIDQAAISGLGIPLPPLAEQHRIVEALEGHLSHLDAAASNVARCELRVPKLEGAIRGRFTGSLTSGDKLPDSWRWGILEDVLERIESGKSFRCEPRPANEQEWGVIKVSAMTWGEFRASEQKAVPAGKEFDRRHEIKEGDILVSRANTADYVGAPVLVKQTRPKLLLSDKSLRVIPAYGVNKDWLITVLASPYVRQQISARATGTKDSMRNISQRELAAVRIPIPPAAEQERVADQVDAYLLASGRFSVEMQLAKARSKDLRASLLNRAFTGTLVPQDPTDEPAAALLARIQADRASQPKAKHVRRAPAAPRKPKAPAAPAPAPAPSPTPAPTHAVQQEFDL